MADAPTHHAEMNFTDAERFFFEVYSGGKSGDLASLATGLSQMATGLKHLSKGLRATYQKLEQIEKRPGGLR